MNTATPLTRTRPSRAEVCLLAILVLYLVGTFSGLAVYPRVGEDEPWIAAAPYKLATEGVLGSDLFAGMAGIERHHYQHMPVYPVLEAVVFDVFGVGVVQMRLLSVLFGLALLVATFVVGRLVGGEWVGLLAVLVLVLVRITEGGEATGILLLDRARINRYDIAVPVFGLLAFCQFLRAERTQNLAAYLAVGALTGLASLSHLYGAFWLVTLLLALAHRNQWSAVGSAAWGATLLGFVVPWIPWIAFISRSWSDYAAQMRVMAERFDVFSFDFYVQNALNPSGPLSVGWLLAIVPTIPWYRIGSWTALVALPVAGLLMLWAPKSAHEAGEPAARTLALVALAQTALFVLVIRMKTLNYMIALWPLGAIGLAWLARRLWSCEWRAVRVALVVLAVGLSGEGFLRLDHARRVARSMRSYDWFTAEVAQCIAPGSRVLGLQHYWLGLRQFPYRTWMMPLFQMNARYTDTPVPFGDAIESLDPDVILIDRYIDELLRLTSNPEDPFHRVWVEYNAFAARRGVQPVCVIRNATYGAMQVYRVPRSGRTSPSEHD